MEVPDLPVTDAFGLSGNPSTQFSLSPERFVEARLVNDLEGDAGEKSLVVKLDGLSFRIARYPRHLQDQPA